MKLFAFLVVLLSISASAQAGTILVGFDDSRNLDYDYQDAVFSLSGGDLLLKSLSPWNAKPTLNSALNTASNNGLLSAPYWNQTSSDAAEANVGYCVWGGGFCNGGVALMPGASFLASDPSTKDGSANDVTFAASQVVTLEVVLRLAGSITEVGWYETDDPSSVNWLPFGGATFAPTGDFGLVARNLTNLETYYSQARLGNSDSVSHYAYFEELPAILGFSPNLVNTPEPGTALLMVAAALALGWTAKKRRS